MGPKEPLNQPDRGRVVSGAHRAPTSPDALIADLRTAFHHYRGALAESDSCCLGPEGAASASGPAPPVPPASALAPGTRVDGFEIVDVIGRGGMGVVYRARQPSLGRDVALKILPDGARLGRSAEGRFLSESCAAARIHHANVVAIHARGEHQGQLYYTMELVDGPSLDGVIRAEPSWFERDFRRLAARFGDLADGLAAAHAGGIVHRDIKPHNILVGPGDRLVLSDFGVARLADAPHLTREGDLLGTPAYLAPEQIASEGRVDERTDVYALGVVLYEVLTGQRPFRGERREQTAQRILEGAPASPRRLAPDVPAALETVCLRAIERDPDRRYQTAAALTDELRRFAAGRTIMTRRPGPLRHAARLLRRYRAHAVAIAALVVLAVVSAGWSVTAAAGRKREAAHLVASAWDVLAFVDYKRGDEVTEALDRASRLGAPPDAVDLALALAELGAERTPEAVDRLDAIQARGNDDRRVDYLLAWALWRAGDVEASLALRRSADDAGGPTTPEAWFFRGLAVHFDDAEDALDSYRTAIQRRAAEQAFYPQAALHLARAHNQRMYATRSLEPFVEAEATLERLADHGAYGAYPHYLLSVAHRLAAEITEGTEDGRGARLRDQHFEQALAWARAGQQIEPDYHHPLMAEAECLEAMGAFADAEAMRTRAIAASPSERGAWEGYHYRWRLRYWMGDLEGALADLDRCAAFDADDRFYTRVYPALVLAELGRSDEAADLAHALATDRTPVGVAWATTTLRLIGCADDANALLADHAATASPEPDADPLRGPGWWDDLLAHLAHGDRRDALEARAAETPTPWMLWSEAAFHDAARRLAADDVDGARAGFRRASRSFDGERRYTYHGKIMWWRLQARPWPTTNIDPRGEKE